MRLFALAFVAGVLLLQQQPALPALRWGGVGIALLLAASLAGRRRAARALLVTAAGAFLGYGYAALRAEARLADALPAALEGREIVVTGVVAGLPRVSTRSTRFPLAVESPREVPREVSLAWYAARGAVSPPRLVPGQRWRLAVRLKRPRGLADPHGFDFEEWALARGMRATGYVRAQPPPRRLGEAAGWTFALHRARAAVRGYMLEVLGEAPLRGVLVALAIGDQDAIAARDWDVFWRTGVGHLMSISGLHITMLAALAYALAAFAWARVPALALALPAPKAASIAGLAAAAAYTLMTGYAVPSQRTLAMLAAIAACRLADRHGAPSRVLALAALACVALDPWAVLAPGFWLSFGAVAAIFHAMALRTGRPGRLRAAFVEQLAVTLAMVPMLLALFGQVSAVSPAANAFAIPVVSLAVVPLTLAGAFLHVGVLLHAAHALMAATMVPLRALAAIPAGVVEAPAPTPLAAAAALAGALWLLAPRGFPLRACGLLWIAPLFLAEPPRPPPGAAWIDVLDVGNGLAVVVRTAGHALVYDAGPAWSEDSDAGSRIVVPFLRGEGIARLDAMVVSHADQDHAGGAAAVMAARAPRRLLSPLPARHPLVAQAPLALRCAAGHRWSWDGVDFAVLHPGAAIYFEADGERSENDRGCVLRVATRGAAMLLAADAEARAESEMLSRDAGALAAAVLLAPHHGSRTSSTPAFLGAVHPSIAIFSVGYRNRFHHPNAAVLARYAARGIAGHRTDREGALRVVLPERAAAAPRVVRLAPRCRYWSLRPCR